MRLLYLASEIAAPNFALPKVRGPRVLKQLSTLSDEIRVCYRVGDDPEPSHSGTQSGKLFGEGPAVISMKEFLSYRPSAVVLEGGLTSRAIGAQSFWSTKSWRLPWRYAIDYLAEGGVIVALDTNLTAAGWTNDLGRLLGDSDMARVFGAHLAMSMDPAEDSAAVQELTDWSAGSGYVLTMRQSELVLPDGMDDVTAGIPAIAVGKPFRLLPAGEPLLQAPLTVGVLREDLAPLTRPDAWTRFAFGSYHHHGKGVAAMIAADITGEDERFQRVSASQHNPKFITQLVGHLVRDASSDESRHHHPFVSRDLPPTRFAGSRVLLLTVTRREREAVEAALPPGDTRWRGSEPVQWWPITRHVMDSGIEFFHAPVGKGVSSALSIRFVVAAIQPRFVVMVGICAGLKEGPQRLGGVVVCSQVRDLGQGKLESPELDGEPVVYREDPKLRSVFPSDAQLLGAFDRASRGRSECGDCQKDFKSVRVEQGEVIALPYVLKMAAIRDHLKSLYPNAVALEMEGAPLALTGATEFADWILVKGISDWADSRKDDAAHSQAAANAMALVVHTFCHSWK